MLTVNLISHRMLFFLLQVVVFVLTVNRDVDGEKSDEDVDGDEVDEDEDEGVDEGVDEEKDTPIVHIGPPKGRSGSGHVKSVTRHDRRDAVDADTFTSSVDGNIFIFVTVNLFLFF